MLVGLIECHAQLTLVLPHIKLYHYNVNLQKGELIEGLDGPVIAINCTIKNLTNDFIQINPPSSSISILFNFNNKTYEKRIEPFFYQDFKSILLGLNKEVSFSISDKILLGTGIYCSEKLNYTKEMLKILPTIRVRYVQDAIEIYSTAIFSVEVYEQ